MRDKMDRKAVMVASSQQLEKHDSNYWKNASLKEKVSTITYLRECFYGPEATTGRFQRIFKFIKQT